MPNNDETPNITLDDLALMMKKGFDNIDEKFSNIDDKFSNIDDRFSSIDNKFSNIDDKFKETNRKIMQESQATRDYTDRKLAELKGDLVTYDKKIIEKVDILTDTLSGKRVITQEERVSVNQLSPFPVAPEV